MHALSHKNERRSFTVNAVILRWPKQENGKEVGATEECDDEYDDHGLFVLAKQLARHHWMSRKSRFPDEEGNNKDNSYDEWHKNMNTRPGIL